jgi:hypothetical protein
MVSQSPKGQCVGWGGVTQDPFDMPTTTGPVMMYECKAVGEMRN